MATTYFYQGHEVMILSHDTEADEAWVYYVNVPDDSEIVRLSEITEEK